MNDKKTDPAGRIPSLPWFGSPERRRILALCEAVPAWKRFYLLRIKNRKMAARADAYWLVAQEMKFAGNEALFERLVATGDEAFCLALGIKLELGLEPA